MNPLPLDNSRRRAAQDFCTAFLLLLGLPLADSIFHWDQTRQVNEKRALAAFPTLQPGWAGIRHFITGMESYYNDHFGFRKRLIYWEQHWQRKWFAHSPNWKVKIGRNGWLYLRDSPKVEALRRQPAYDPELLRQWQALLERRRDWLARRGIQYLFVVAPHKDTAYPEYLPDDLRDSVKTKLDEFFGYLAAHSTVPVLDLRNALERAKKRAPTYHHTDSHWNMYGAFCGYQELVRALGRQQPGLEPLPIDAFEIKTGSGPGGNLAWLLADSEAMPEKEVPDFRPRLPLLPLTENKGPPPQSLVTVENPVANGKAMLFHDSFANSWTQFLSRHFGRTDWYWQHYWNAAAIELEKPDVVIDEFVEDLLYEADPAELMRRDGLKE